VGVVGQPAPQAASRRLRAVERVRSLILAGLLAGCSGSNPLAKVASPGESFTELKQKVALIRGLPFKRAVTLANGSPNPNEASPDPAGEEYAAQSLPHLSRAYKRLGLLSESIDFSSALAEYSRLQRLLYYEARTKAITIAQESSKPGGGKLGPNGDPEPLPAVVALTQALQEQYFQWQAKLRLISFEDRKLAFRAVAGGDALLVASAYMAELRPMKTADPVPIVAQWATVLEKMSAHLPELLRQKLIFPYREGSRFVQWAQAAKGWAGVNALYADPPLSTSQVLHAEKYYVTRENPVRIIPWGLARQMNEPAVVDQTLGEYLIQLLLSASVSRKEATQIAAASTGDQLTGYLHGENLLIAWISAWKSEKDAQAFYRAYQALLEGRHRVRFSRSAARNDSLQAGPSGGSAMLLQRRGPFVLLLDGLASAEALPLADEIWRNLDAETESIVIPFESAKRAAQLSLISR
jgi:hypothetical protein